jgi:hypothetical protein
MVFIDLTKAFDSINRTGLWSFLAKFGCPSKLINIIKLHDGMIGRVCADGKESDGFEVTAGVKQGCLIAPSLFSLFFAAMLSKGSHVGHAIRDHKTIRSGTEGYSAFSG